MVFNIFHQKYLKTQGFSLVLARAGSLAFRELTKNISFSKWNRCYLGLAGCVRGPSKSASLTEQIWMVFIYFRLKRMTGSETKLFRNDPARKVMGSHTSQNDKNKPWRGYGQLASNSSWRGYGQLQKRSAVDHTPKGYGQQCLAGYGQLDLASATE